MAHSCSSGSSDSDSGENLITTNQWSECVTILWTNSFCTVEFRERQRENETQNKNEIEKTQIARNERINERENHTSGKILETKHEQQQQQQNCFLFFSSVLKHRKGDFSTFCFFSLQIVVCVRALMFCFIWSIGIQLIRIELNRIESITEAISEFEIYFSNSTKINEATKMQYGHRVREWEITSH